MPETPSARLKAQQLLENSGVVLLPVPCLGVLIRVAKSAKSCRYTIFIYCIHIYIYTHNYTHTLIYIYYTDISHIYIYTYMYILIIQIHITYIIIYIHIDICIRVYTHIYNITYIIIYIYTYTWEWTTCSLWCLFRFLVSTYRLRWWLWFDKAHSAEHIFHRVP